MVESDEYIRWLSPVLNPVILPVIFELFPELRKIDIYPALRNVCQKGAGSTDGSDGSTNPIANCPDGSTDGSTGGSHVPRTVPEFPG